MSFYFKDVRLAISLLLVTLLKSTVSPRYFYRVESAMRIWRVVTAVFKNNISFYEQKKYTTI